MRLVAHFHFGEASHQESLQFFIGGTMFKKLWILSVLILTGCATPPQVWRYPDFTIIKASQSTIDRVCKPDRIWFKCCWKKAKKEIWVEEFSPECLVNELCHQQGIDVEVCERDYRWGK